MDPFVYQYVIGGVIFVIGLVYAHKQGYLGRDRVGVRNWVLLVGGFVFFMAVQGYMQYAPMSELPASPQAAPTASNGGEGVGGENGGRQTVGQPIDYAVMVAYLVVILAVGLWFGRKNKTTRDFFFGGQRFSWWLIAFSLVATLVGSYSFVKYSRAAFTYGFSSSQTYLNDWALMPLLLFGWLPILYFSRITSLPEYFGRRYNSTVRFWATISLLVYLISYIGVNMYTMGTVLHYLLGWEVFWAAAAVASISVIYVTIGGQTSVIMTDLLQGVMLLLAGLIVFVLGIDYLGGFGVFWESLPRGHRRAFDNFNTDKSFPSVGIFWQDGVANSAFFYFLNQGILMRFMAARSIKESRKAAIALPLLLMPIAAIVVAGGGWIAKALVQRGSMPEMKPDEAFYLTAEFLAKPGIFGLILAALTAALMSTVDTLITAVSAVAVNDLYKPYVNPKATDKQLLRVARISAVAVTLIGVALVPIYMGFKTIYAAHGAMTAAVTPPLVVALMLAVFWRRFTAKAALATIAGGLFAIIVSVFVPEIIAPFAHGVPFDADYRSDPDAGLFAGARQFKFMRALFGLSVSAAIGITVTFFTKPEPEEKQRGLVWGTVADAIRHYKGSDGEERASTRAMAMPRQAKDEKPRHGDAGLPVVAINRALADALKAEAGDLVYVSDARRWLGGLRSTHASVGEVLDDDGASTIEIGPDTFSSVVSPKRTDREVVVERLY